MLFKFLERTTFYSAFDEALKIAVAENSVNKRSFTRDHFEVPVIFTHDHFFFAKSDLP